MEVHNLWWHRYAAEGTRLALALLRQARAHLDGIRQRKMRRL